MVDWARLDLLWRLLLENVLEVVLLCLLRLLRRAAPLLLPDATVPLLRPAAVVLMRAANARSVHLAMGAVLVGAEIGVSKLIKLVKAVKTSGVAKLVNTLKSSDAVELVV